MILGNELVAYVHNAQDVETSSRNRVKYFKMKLQTAQGEVSDAVSYKPELQDTMKEASCSKSPVKITGFRREANYFNNKKQDVEMGRSAKVRLLSRAAFAYEEMNAEVADFVPVNRILEEGYDRQLVSVTGYVRIDNCYSFRKHFVNIFSSLSTVGATHNILKIQYPKH